MSPALLDEMCREHRVLTAHNIQWDMDTDLCEENKTRMQAKFEDAARDQDQKILSTSDRQREKGTRKNPADSKLKKNVPKMKVKKLKSERELSYESTGLEDSPAEVLERFKRGCECQDDQCFKGLNPETVYRHRLNIAELTKAEHDMYLMGVTMACLTNPYETARHTERRRLRAQYVYQGRRVCLDAFLYLENCTHYQMKRIRKHIMTHGVTPRVHGNHGKIPHNTFSLDIYKIATQFLKSFIELQEAKQKTKVAKNAQLHLPPDVTCKVVYASYVQYCKNMSPNIKIMGYSTFRRFMKVQFPQVKFAKLEFPIRSQNVQGCSKVELEKDVVDERKSKSADLISEDGALLPLLIASEAGQSDTYFLTPAGKLQDVISYQITASGLLVNKPALPV